jgi:hypothetical protein
MPYRFSAAIVSAATINSGAAYAEMLAGATKPISVRSIRVTTLSGVGGAVALSRSFALGTGTSIATGIGARVTATTPTTTAQINAAWSSNPTGFVSKLREDVLPLGTGIMRELWGADDGPLVIEPGKSILIMNQGSGIQGGALLVSALWEEGDVSQR